MSDKDCGNHGWYKRRKILRRIFAAFLALLFIVGLSVLIIWLVLRPTKPRFYLQDTTVNVFNLSGDGTNQLTTQIQVTISSRNPNARIGVYYDRIDVFAQYYGQQITAATALPTGYQGHKDVTVWSPYLYGAATPLAPYLASSLQQDDAAGYLLLYIKVHGRIRWKVGTWISGHYHLDVSCPAFLTVADGNSPTPTFHFQQISSCRVEV